MVNRTEGRLNLQRLSSTAIRWKSDEQGRNEQMELKTRIRRPEAALKVAASSQTTPKAERGGGQTKRSS